MNKGTNKENTKSNVGNAKEKLRGRKNWKKLQWNEINEVK